MTTGRIWPAIANEERPSTPAQPPQPAQPAPRRAKRRQTVATDRSLAGAGLREDKGGAREERREHEQMVLFEMRMLLMLVACLAVCMPAMYVVCVRSGPCVVGGSRYKVLPCDACALRPYWCLWPPGSCVGCWGRQAPPERRVYTHLKRSKRRDILTKHRSHPRRFVGSSATCGCTNS